MSKPSYYDIDDILAVQERVPCVLQVDLDGLGSAGSGGSSKVHRNSRWALPFWMADRLNEEDYVNMEVSPMFSKQANRMYAASPVSVQLRAISQHYYQFGLHLGDLVPEVPQVLQNMYMQRLQKIAQISQQGGNIETLDFVQSLDKTESRMLKLCQQSKSSMTDGIGGMHFALKQAKVEAQVVRAFDINNVANDVYSHNFGDVPVVQRSIDSLPMTLFEALKADLWTMSPPCQPYTRQGLQRGSDDMRAKSFLFIIDLLGKLQNKPMYLLMENVAGFEKSDTRGILLRQLVKVGYRFEEYLLNPLQLGYPNSRTRYYLLAKRDASPRECLEEFLPQFHYQVPGAGLIPPAADSQGLVDFEKTAWNHDKVRPVKEFMEALSGEDAVAYQLSQKVLDKHGYVHDVVTPEDRRTCCFTKGYTHYAEGTGSVLQTKGVVGQDPMTAENTRYFTPREVANLMGFPATFTFPENTSRKQRYRLLGNSLSVSVVAVLIDYLLNRM
ncbi:hypothetical protein IWW42_000208 [Coemansia sp. RSA 1085]|nr:hypothetical protein IWW42_000208 [Coemansia sp. RSA 1085]